MTDRVKKFVQSLKLIGKTLEVGSYDVNGRVRDDVEEYIGIDVRGGPNVDIQTNGHDLCFWDESFDNVICLDTLEHDPRFWETISELKRVLKKDGTLVIAVPGIHYSKHDYPGDYYRFTPEAVESFYTGFYGVYVQEKDKSIVSMGLKVK